MYVNSERKMHGWREGCMDGERDAWLDGGEVGR